MHPLMSLTDVSFAYGPLPVLCGVSLGVSPGEIVGVVGPNGAGKSTLLKLMGGTLTPSGGEIMLDAVPLQAIPVKRRARTIAFVPQESPIPFSFRAMEVVLMGRAPHLPAFGFESQRDLSIARDAMEQMGCAGLARRDINELSGGERQRVILARALAQEPHLLLLDEPATFLDIRHQIDLHRLLEKLRREKEMAIVAAMHDLNLAAAFCDRIVMLKEGIIAAAGTPSEVITAQHIRDVFHAEVYVGANPESGCPYCLPSSSTP